MSSRIGSLVQNSGSGIPTSCPLLKDKTEFAVTEYEVELQIYLVPSGIGDHILMDLIQKHSLCVRICPKGIVNFR